MQPPLPTIRPATPDDLPAIVGLIRELAAYERLEHLVVATPESIAPHLFGPRPAAEALVAQVGGGQGEAGGAGRPGDAGGAGEAGAADAGGARLVAFALYFTNFSTFLGRPGLYLEDLYVQPAYRGAGLGRAMLRRLGALAVQRGCGRFEWSVLDWNADAIRFYEKMGATVLSDWRICRITGDRLAAFGRGDSATSGAGAGGQGRADGPLGP